MLCEGVAPARGHGVVRQNPHFGRLAAGQHNVSDGDVAGGHIVAGGVVDAAELSFFLSLALLSFSCANKGSTSSHPQVRVANV